MTHFLAGMERDLAGGASFTDYPDYPDLLFHEPG